MRVAAVKHEDKNHRTNNFINYENFFEFVDNWKESKPFSHVVLDNFINENFLEKIASEFPDYNSNIWHEYNNPLEIKKTCNSWNSFGKNTYQLFYYLNSSAFLKKLEVLTGCELFADYGLNGGGLHTHKSGGKLNTHLDYSMHPKINFERKLNIIIYITPDWNPNWGGELGLWANNSENDKPGELVKNIIPYYNRAVIFDTTQKSWHGLPDELKTPNGICRNSLATYYLCEPQMTADKRAKALFHPSESQKNDLTIRNLIANRADINKFQTAYIK